MAPDQTVYPSPKEVTLGDFLLLFAVCFFLNSLIQINPLD